jgi:uncharacterized protein (DUF2164 family)
MVFAVRVLTVKVSARLRQNTDNAATGMDQIFFLNDIALNMVAAFYNIRPNDRYTHFETHCRLSILLLERHRQRT